MRKQERGTLHFFFFFGTVPVFWSQKFPSNLKWTPFRVLLTGWEISLPYPVFSVGVLLWMILSPFRCRQFQTSLFYNPTPPIRSIPKCWGNRHFQYTFLSCEQRFCHIMAENILNGKKWGPAVERRRSSLYKIAITLTLACKTDRILSRQCNKIISPVLSISQ